MTRPTKASSAGSTQGQGSRLGSVRRAFAIRGASATSQGSSAPSTSTPSPSSAEQAHLQATVGPRRRTSLAIFTAFVCAAGLALTAAPAFAANVHIFSTSFGTSGSGDAQLSLVAFDQNTGTAGSGLALNQTTHDLYVADTGNARVDQFDSAGAFIRAFGADVGGAGVNVCTTGCVAGTPGTSPGAFTTPTFIAIDNSCAQQEPPLSGLACETFDPSNGDVYVGDTTNNVVTKFEADGTLVSRWGAGGQLDGTPALATGDGTTTSGSTQITELTTSTGAFAAGQTISGPGIPSGTRIESAEPTELFLSEAATATATGVGLSSRLRFSALGLAGLAVDASGNLFVYDQNGEMFRFAQDSTFTADFNSGFGVTPAGIAVDFAGNLYIVRGDPVVEKLTSTGADLGQVTADDTDFQGHTSGVTLDPSTGDLYVGWRGSEIRQYAATCDPSAGPCTPVDTFGSGDLSASAGLAIDSSTAAVYAADSGNARIAVFAPATLPDTATDAATAIGPTTATLNGTVNPAGVQLTDCHFDLGTNTNYTLPPVPCDTADGNPISGPGDIPADSADHAVSADVSGLSVGTTYHFRLVAANASGQTQGQDSSFSTPPPPSIDAAAVQNLTGTEADLTARINPNGLDTTYHFEWGTADCASNPCTSVPVPDADIGSGNSPVPVTGHLAGLSSDTTYHFRLLATNAAGTTTTVDHTFRYDTSGGGLPDGRAYELVTPPNKDGAVVGPLPVATIAADGNSLVGGSTEAFAGLPSDELCTLCVADYQFTRTSSGWVTTPLNPFQTSSQSIGIDNSVWAPSSVGLQVDHLYLREADGSVSDIGPAWPPALGPYQRGGAPYVVLGAAGDASHGVLFAIIDPTELWPGDTTLSAPSLYEYTGTGNAAPSLVGVSGGAGSTTLESGCGTTLGSSQFVAGARSDYNAVSQDGSTVFFTAAGADDVNCGGTEPPADELFARIDESRTVAISQPSASDCPTCDTGSPQDAAFQGASADGSKAFFTTSQPLLGSDSTNNLYLYDFTPPAGQPKVVRVSAGDGTGSGSPDVQGVARISEDGSHVYFVAQGVLTAAANSQGQHAQAGADNLYLYERDAQYPAGRTAFIADLCSDAGTSGTVADSQCPPNLSASASFEDHQLWGGDQAQGDQSRPAQVTPDGRFLVFTSYADLTPDDTSSAAQVFQYDAQTGALARISIGEQGFNDNGNAGSGGNPTNDAGIVTQDYANGGSRGGAIARTMSDDGSYVFFQSPVGLTPQALNDAQADVDGSGNPLYAENIYEYHDGHVHLISDGRDVTSQQEHHGSNVQLIGTDASGANVFFTTADQLVPQDTDTQVDFYDARVGGGFQPSQPPPQCQGDACQPLSGPPSDQSPGSGSFNGPGNPAPVHQQPKHCRKGKLLKHGKCVKKHHYKHRRHR